MHGLGLVVSSNFSFMMDRSGVLAKTLEMGLFRVMNSSLNSLSLGMMESWGFKRRS